FVPGRGRPLDLHLLRAGRLGSPHDRSSQGRSRSLLPVRLQPDDPDAVPGPLVGGAGRSTPGGRHPAGPGVGGPASGPDSATRRGGGRAALDAGLKEFGAVAPRGVSPGKSLPNGGLGVGPDGSATLAVTDKPILWDLTKQIPPSAIHRAFVDSVTLSAVEWS